MSRPYLYWCREKADSMHLFDPDTVRLTLVNIGLGVACAFFLVVVARAIIRDLAERAESGKAPPAPVGRDAPGRRRTQLGVTMADGGEPISAGPPAGADPSSAPRRPGIRHLNRTIL
jgi:hypothetical protein